MPPQRGSRGSYARYICTNCRSRKIKCVLPNDLDLSPSGKAQPEEKSCQRCRTKGLDCVVGYTTLGRPSRNSGASTMRAKHLSPSSLENRSMLRDNTRSPSSIAFEEMQSEDGLDEVLLSRPRRTTDHDQPDNAAVSNRQDSESLDKFLALASPSYLLSTLLMRDKHFGVAITPPSENQRSNVFNLLDDKIIGVLDSRLVWHRLYFPDIPPLSELYKQAQAKDEVAQFSLATTLLLILLCSVAIDVARDTVLDRPHFQTKLDAMLYFHGQEVLFSQPCHRRTVLALELLQAFRPQALCIDRTTAVFSVRGRLLPPLIMELALELKLNHSPSKILRDDGTINEAILKDSFLWYRNVLRDINTALMGEGRQFEKRQLRGGLAVDIICRLEALLNAHIPKEFFYLANSLLCKARQLEYALRIKEDWRNLEHLGKMFEEYMELCETHRLQLRPRLASLQGLRPGEAMSISNLLDMELHRSFIFVSGYATFFAIVAGAEVARQAPTGTDPTKEQMMEIADQIIERFAEPTRDFHADDPHTEFIVKYGDRRIADLEKALSDVITCLDTLKIDGIPYIGSTTQINCAVLSLVKEVMEGEAARMKGWGGLHERVDVQLLLIRGCASSLERIGSNATGTSGATALSTGCLWAATARLLWSLHGLLSRWKEWDALGQARVSAPSLTLKPLATKDHDSTLGGLGQIGMTDITDFDLLPDDLFFDWNLWQKAEADWSFV